MEIITNKDINLIWCLLRMRNLWAKWLPGVLIWPPSATVRSICSRYLSDLSYQCWLYLVPATVENWFASSIFRTIWFELTIYWSFFRTPRRGTPNLPTHSGFLHQNQSSCNSSSLVKTLFSVIHKLSTLMWSLAQQSQDFITFPYVAIYIIYAELKN